MAKPQLPKLMDVGSIGITRFNQLKHVPVVWVTLVPALMD